jgi:GT2 family glycosyltransferase
MTLDIDIDCSVIIVTYKREEFLVNTIAKFDEIFKYNSKYELLIINQNSDLNEQKILKNRPWLKYWNLSQPGMVAARNFGLKNANGKIVLYVDDDVEPLKDLIKEHIVAYCDESVGGVAGRIIEGLESEVKNKNQDSLIHPVYGWERISFNHQVPCEVMTSRGCNMSFKKDLLIKIGGFDNNIKIFRDDTEICFRVRKEGFRIWFAPKAGLYHLNAKTGGTRSSNKHKLGPIKKEIEMYYYCHRHYRDNLYFILKHLRGLVLVRSLWSSYFIYVGFSRWPWRVLGKNIAFILAFFNAIINLRKI